MRSLTALLLLVLLFSSCQQRYWQVKKVKADKTKTAGRKKIEKHTVDSVSHSALYDSNHQNVAGQTRNSEKGLESVTGQWQNHEELVEEGKLYQPPKTSIKRHFQGIIPKVLPSDPKDEPLTQEEILLIFAIFFITLFLVSLVLGLIIGFFIFWLMIAAIAYGVLELLLFIILILALGYVIIVITSFFLGRNQIRKRIEKPISDTDLLTYYLSVVGGTSLLGSVLALVGSPLVSIIFLLLFVIALVYSITYNK